MRTNSQTGSTVQTPAAGGSASTSIDAKANGSGIRADSAGGVSASAGTPIVSGSAWGSAQPSAQVSTPDLDATKDTAKNAAKNTVDGLEDRRDRIEGRTDKKVDRTIDKL